VSTLANRQPQADPSELTDEMLLLGYRSTGDHALFEQLVKRYEQPLYSYLRRYLGNSEMAEDVFQSTFLQVHVKCAQFQSGRKVHPWLYRIATNQAIDALRRRRCRPALSLDVWCRWQDGHTQPWIDVMADDDPGALAHLERQEAQSGTTRALNQLPEPLKQVVILVFFEGLKYREAAEVLSIPLGTVKSRMHAALRRLQESIHAV